MTSVPYDGLLLPFDAPFDSADLGLDGLPSLGAFSADPRNMRTSAVSASAAAQRLFDIVSNLCVAYGFRPIIGELAYLSDPVLRAGLEIELNSFTAAVLDQAWFSIPESSTHQTPYIRALEKMVAPDPNGLRRPEPIGGHPSLWQAHPKHGPRVGYVTFQTDGGDDGEADFSISGFAADNVEPDPHMDVSLPTRTPLQIDVEYSESVEKAFRRFVRYFLLAAKEDAEAAPHRLAASFNRLLATRFLGVPFVRAASQTDSATARKLSGLGWSPARGAMLLLFLKPIQPVDVIDEAGGRRQEVSADGLARALHTLLMDTGLREAAERSRDQRGLLNYLADIVHDTRHVVRAIQPDTIWSVVASGPEVFCKRDWDYIISDHQGARAPQKEALLVDAFSAMTSIVDLAQKSLGLLEFRARGGVLAHKFTAIGATATRNPGSAPPGPVSLRSLIDRALSTLEIFLGGDLAQDQHLQLDWCNAEEVEFPPDYLHTDYILPIIYETLLNCSKHGRTSNGFVAVRVTVTLRRQGKDSPAPTDCLDCDLEFSNAFDSEVSTPSHKYADFIDQVAVSRDFSNGMFSQKITLRPFQVYDETDRITDRWTSAVRRQA